ncbi:MAG: PAS domain-containing protein [Spirochaetes bacterium]|nr:PAS domain-containing protein [Spirochaetota bacterium]
MKKIRNKIILSIISLIILLILVMAAFINNLIKNTHLDIIKREMTEKSDFIDIILKDNPDIYTGKISSRFTEKIKKISNTTSLRVTIVDFTGNVIADSDFDPASMDNHRYRIEVKDAIEKKSGESIRYSNTLNTDMLYLAKKMDKYVIRLAKPLQEIDETLSKFSKTIFGAGFILIVIALIFLIIISNKITNPISKTRDFAIAFSEGDYSKRITDYSKDEIGILQKILNKMADSIVSEMNQLMTEQNKLKITFESISDGIAVIDKDKHIVMANKAFASLLGIDPGSAANKIYYEVIRGSYLNKNIEQSLKTGKPTEFQEKLFSEKYCEIFIVPIKDKSGIEGILLVVHDITEKKKIDQLKTDLVGNLSHELKTPIAILKGYLETIQLNPDDTELNAEYIAKALINLERQNSIINDMLKLNMLETMKEASFEKINIKDIILNCIEILNAKAKTKEVEIKSDIDLLNKPVEGNKFLAEEIFFNIILNGINYNNPKGKINIEAKESNGKITVSIADTGIGIPKDSINRIFERFYRVDKSRSRATGGTGLGLSIVKHAAEILGWEINVESDAKGTAFYIEI